MRVVRIMNYTNPKKIEVVAEMPLFVLKLADWLCRRSEPWGILGGLIINSYKWDYGTGRSWWASLVSGVKTWWGCRREWRA